ncbi:MAG: M28 family peptidase [Candidatus Eremiobacteraeota bacterium]|nr:M28 family peptidase [Candidatus Eremiobacteraeota bacterium]
MNSRTFACFLALALAGCHSMSGGQPAFLPEARVAAISPHECQQRRNDTLAKLEQCIQRASLWQHLSEFQRIADAHPGSNGHPNRDTGTSGYAASVAYVAKLMRKAGYDVRIQQYNYERVDVVGTPTFVADAGPLSFEKDWFVARLSGSGAVEAPVVPPSRSAEGCSRDDFARFPKGDIALLARGRCSFDAQVRNAQAAGARGVVLYNDGEGAFEARLIDRARIPVIGVVTRAIGDDFVRRYRAGTARRAVIAINERVKSGVDYNLIADSPFGDATHTVVLEGHLDSIYGAGMLDNASGSTSILDIALALAKTPTRNRLRYIWFGGEEIGLLGSRYYTTHLSKTELHAIAFDIDADVTATPNFDMLVADPRFASRVKEFPPNVVPESKIGNDAFKNFFDMGGVVSRAAHFGNDGTDSLSFSLAGVPNSGILTQQDCCKHTWERKLWGGFLGNYEGKIPSFNGGCVDYPDRWCDNLSNNDAFVLELASKAVAYVTFTLANYHFPW